MDIAGRIKQLLSEYHVSQAELARCMNVSPSHISHVISGNKTPSIETIKRICSCLGISLSEFFSTENVLLNTPTHIAMLKKSCDGLSPSEASALQHIIMCLKAKSTESPLLKKQRKTSKRLIYPRAHFKNVQRALGQAAAGSPLFNDISDGDVFVRVPSKYLDATRFFVVQAKGDSMMPNINDGDFVVVQKSTPPTPGGLALVRVDDNGADEYVIKLFFRLQSKIELRSYNPDYTPQVYQFREVLAAEQIVSIIRADEA